MAGQRDLSSGCKTYEIYEKDSGRRPFSEALASSGRTAVQPINKMRMLQDLGWPRASLQLKDSYGKYRIVRKDDLIWLLKCKPSCWRLYFYVFENGNDKYI